MVAKEHPLARGMIVGAIIKDMRGGTARGVQCHHFGSDEGAVVAVGDGEHAQRADHKRKRTHRAELYTTVIPCACLPVGGVTSREATSELYTLTPRKMSSGRPLPFRHYTLADPPKPQWREVWRGHSFPFSI